MLQGSTRLSLHPSLPHRSTGRERAIETGGDGGVLSGERSARLSCHPDRLMFPFYGSLLCQLSLSVSVCLSVFLFLYTYLCLSIAIYLSCPNTEFYHFSPSSIFPSAGLVPSYIRIYSILSFFPSLSSSTNQSISGHILTCS